MRRHAVVLLCLCLFAGCAQPVPTTSQAGATLPPGEAGSLADPTRAAIIGAAWAFGGPGRLANQPAEAAEAVARLSYLAAEIPTGGRWRQFSPIVGVQLRQGEAEAWAALGIPPDAPPQRVIDALFAARAALRAGNMPAAEAALPADLFPAGGRVAIARLGALPVLPAAAAGTRGAQVELGRDDAPGDLD